MTPEQIDHHVDTARHAVLSTIQPDGRPHLVPITFARLGPALVTAIDHKPKRTTRLRRLSNIERDERVSVLIEHYAEDWQCLWWVRIDGTAATVGPEQPEHATVVAPLHAKYTHYANRALGTAIVITPTRRSGWSASSAINNA